VGDHQVDAFGDVQKDLPPNDEQDTDRNLLGTTGKSVLDKDHFHLSHFPDADADDPTIT